MKKRAGKPLVIKNPHPDVELTVKQEHFLNQINLNQVEYGSGHQSWEIPQPQDISIALYRYRERKGSFVFSPGSDFSFDIEIPCTLVVRFLAGDITPAEVWDDKSSGSNACPSLKETIGHHLRLAAQLNQQIVNVGFVQIDPKSIDQSRVRLEFSTLNYLRKPIEACPRAFIKCIKTDSNGAFTLKFTQNLMVFLLAGKITASDLWKSHNKQEIGHFLKDAVSRGQEIIDAKLVQSDSETESQPSLLLCFAAATDTTIREDKKILQEERQRKKKQKKQDKKK
ncbi:MAG: hypothetical protein F6K58_02645 [Symploca sp. SIO2E9]|nr:hypothetical protein [Symploca sp. SIO2E9]